MVVVDNRYQGLGIQTNTYLLFTNDNVLFPMGNSYQRERRPFESNVRCAARGLMNKNLSSAVPQSVHNAPKRSQYRGHIVLRSQEEFDVWNVKSTCGCCMGIITWSSERTFLTL